MLRPISNVVSERNPHMLGTYDFGSRKRTVQALKRPKTAVSKRDCHIRVKQTTNTPQEAR